MTSCERMDYLKIQGADDHELERLSAALHAEDCALAEKEVQSYATVGIVLTREEALALIWPHRKLERMAKWILTAGGFAPDGKAPIQH